MIIVDSFICFHHWFIQSEGALFHYFLLLLCSISVTAQFAKTDYLSKEDFAMTFSPLEQATYARTHVRTKCTKPISVSFFATMTTT